MSGNSYYDDDMSEEDYERIMEHMYEFGASSRSLMTLAPTS